MKNPRGTNAIVLDYDIVVSEFELQSHYYVQSKRREFFNTPNIG